MKYHYAGVPAPNGNFLAMTEVGVKMLLTTTNALSKTLKTTMNISPLIN